MCGPETTEFEDQATHTIIFLTTKIQLITFIVYVTSSRYFQY